jgi:C_GCAxxG_C_C family probable redox protein
VTLVLSKEKTLEVAMELYRVREHNCGESVSSALASALGLDATLFLKAGTPFGGGFGGEHKYFCGALTSAVLATGLALGRTSPEESREPAYSVATQIRKDFEAEFGSINCHEICGLSAASGDEWSIPYEEKKIRENRCQQFVRFTVQRWYDLVAAQLETEKNKDKK